MKQRNATVENIVTGSVIAALYTVLTLACSLLGLSSGAIQLRLSEALCILPVFAPAAVPGLFIGCLLSNLLSGGLIYDVIFGSLATLLGAIGTRLLRKHKVLSLLPPIFANTLIIPFVLVKVYGAEEALWVLFLTVGAGEILSAGVLGYILERALYKHPEILKPGK